MRIAQIAPLFESVPPKLYGGTERIVSYLTEELVRLGHDVTLFASGDSTTRAELVPCGEAGLRLSGVKDPIPHYMIMLDELRARADAFDILHFHIDCLHFPLFAELAPRTVTTLHGRQDLPDLWPFYRHFRHMPLISISEAQRVPIAHANFVATIHHGIPAHLYRPSIEPGRYLAFLGRMSPEKRPDRAIRIARRAGLPLRLAAKINAEEAQYFREEIEPLLGDGIDYVGEIGEHDKPAFLRNASALLFPIDWPEPFGLVMIEAMACGTPVVAFRCGSVQEVVDDGITGRIVDSEEEAAASLREVLGYDRRQVRRRFEERFTAARMAAQYHALYESRLARLQSEERVPVASGLRSLIADHAAALAPAVSGAPLPALP
jgi:glycosyltransferase involved in cell wall biosynthesis